MNKISTFIICGIVAISSLVLLFIYSPNTPQYSYYRFNNFDVYYTVIDIDRGAFDPPMVGDRLQFNFLIQNNYPGNVTLVYEDYQAHSNNNNMFQNTTAISKQGVLNFTRYFVPQQAGINEIDTKMELYTRPDVDRFGDASQITKLVEQKNFQLYSKRFYTASENFERSTSIGTMLIVAATTALVGVTLYNSIHSKKTIELSIMPYLKSSLTVLGPTNIVLKISNVGNGPANNIKLQYWIGSSLLRRSWTKPLLVPKDGEDIFIQSDDGQIRTSMDYFQNNPTVLNLQGEYEDILGKKHQVVDSIDITQIVKDHNQSSVMWKEDPLNVIADHLEGIKSSLSSRELSKRLFRNLPTSNEEVPKEKTDENSDKSKKDK